MSVGASGSISAQVELGVEVVEGDDPDARQDRVERRDVVLEIEQRDVEPGQLTAGELTECEQPELAAVIECGEVRREVAVVAAQQHVVLMALESLQGALDADVDDLLVG